VRERPSLRISRPSSRVLKSSQERGYRGSGGCPPRFRKPGREPSPKAACDVAEAARQRKGEAGPATAARREAAFAFREGRRTALRSLGETAKTRPPARNGCR
jgi:hypothetical protein